jgi:tetratricopeptide (TPR) repeat protein
LRGLGYQLQGNYSAAIATFREALDVRQAQEPESAGWALLLHSIADAERLAGDYAAAERDCREALRVARQVDDHHNEPVYATTLVALALDCHAASEAEAWAREALSLAEAVGRQELIALNSQYLAQALSWQDRPAAGAPYAQRAIEVFTRLRSPYLAKAQAVLKECEEAATDGIG